jgi:predicted Zn-dependent peptidase
MKHGRISQIKSIHFTDIQNHWKHFMEDEQGVLFTTSPQPLSDLQHVFTMCEWKKMIVPPFKPPTFEINKKQSLFVGNSNVEQAHILMASDVCGIQSGDIFYALQVAVHLLGGSFDSRLSRVLRIEKGLTYDVSMYIQDGLHSSLLFIQTAVEEIRPSLDIIIKICQEAEKNWSDQDIERGIFNMQYEYLNSFATGRRSMSLLEERYLLRKDGCNTLECTNISPYENIRVQDVRKALLTISQLQWFSIVLGHPSDFSSLKKHYEFVKCQEIDYM